MSFDIDPALAKEAEKIAGQTGQPVSTVVNEALRRSLPKLRLPASGRVEGWLANDDVFFEIMERIETERHARTGREPIQFE